MLIINDGAFDPNVPEEYPWEQVDSIIMSNVAEAIVKRIKDDLAEDSTRQNIPGLRLALYLAADYVEIV